MKKILSMVAVGASALVAVGDPITVSSFDVGVTAIQSSTTNTIVSVSYKDLAAAGNIAVSNLVKTANLEANDTLRVYDSASGMFTVFTLDAKGGFWRETTTLTGADEESADPGTTTLNAGIGIWLVRGSNWDGKPFTFYIYGKPTVAPTTSETGMTIPCNKAVLCGNCKGVAAIPNVDNKVKGDKIVIPVNNLTGTRMYNWNGSSWKVGKYTLSASDIPPGTGFWYVPNGTGSDRKLYW